MALEHILTEVNEQNYDLHQRVEALTVLERAQSRELVEELTRLNKANIVLNEKLRGIETLLLDAMTDDKKDLYRLAFAETSSIMGLSDSIGSKTPVLEETKKAKALRNELSNRTSKQRDKIRKIRIVLDGLFGRNTDARSAGGSLSQEAPSSVSQLTSNSSNRSYNTPFSLAHPKIASPRGDQLSSATPPPLDDLEVLLQHAAAHDHAHRARRRQRLAVAAEMVADASPPPPPATAAAAAAAAPLDTDDLSTILHWAASRERPETNKRVQPASVSSSWSPIKPTGKTKAKKEKGKSEWVLPAILPSKKSRRIEE